MQFPEAAHTAAALVQTPARFAFGRLSAAEFVGGWSLGSMGLQPVGPAVFKGRSLFDGSEAFVEIRPNPELGLIDFSVGSAERRDPRIFIRVTPGEVIARDTACCLVSLHALRSGGATPEAWARTCVTHEAEILLIKAQLEAAYGAGDRS
ncbi:MAG: hypothetical protein NXH83_01670 [Rhodobacteraceae bacterium]|nr:hypothetical protein [Paracoccaceae bacterium]